jgi:hypothetical protein
MDESNKPYVFVCQSQDKCQLADRAGIVAPQNLHFTGFLFWSEKNSIIDFIILRFGSPSFFEINFK